MRAERKHDYVIEGYGTVMFVKAALGSGHHSFKVYWRRTGQEKTTRLAWLAEGIKPSAELAVFYLQDGVRHRRRIRPVSLPR
jgi:hypothetical protein